MNSDVTLLRELYDILTQNRGDPDTVSASELNYDPESASDPESDSDHE